MVIVWAWLDIIFGTSLLVFLCVLGVRNNTRARELVPDLDKILVIN